MSEFPPCPACQSPYAYSDGALMICPECGHEWSPEEEAERLKAQQVMDAYGNILHDGDSVSVLKDLKIKGSSQVVKVGTRVKSIRLIDPDANSGHDIDCKVDGLGALKIRSKFVKKA